MRLAGGTMLLAALMAAAAPCRAQVPGEDTTELPVENGREAGTKEPPNPSGLAADELAKRKQALETWTQEPIAIEGSLFLFHFDRRDGSFFFQDRRTGVKWFSSWGRRGFASVLPRGGAGGAPEWLPIDRVEGLASGEEGKLCFNGASSRGPAPPIHFDVETMAGGGGLSLRFQVLPEGHGRVAAVRLLDGALWIPDAEKGGAAVPDGIGAWHEPDGPDLRKRLDAAAARATLPFLVLLRSENPLLVKWRGEPSAVEVDRHRASGEGFPGRGGLFVTLELSSATGAVDLVSAGKERMGAIDAVQAYKQLYGGVDQHEMTLRYKTGVKPELRSFLGAAIFRLEVGPRRTFADAARLAERWKRELGIDEAAIVLGGWSSTAASPPGVSLLPARPDAGGDDGLSSCASGVKQAGFLFGLELPHPVDPSGSLTAIKDLCAPQILFLREPGGRAAASDAGTRAAFLSALREDFGLVGLGRGAEGDLRHAAWLDGFLAGFARATPPPDAWPLFPAAYGNCVRLSLGPDDAIGPDEPEAILAHLLLGEVPGYAVPEPGAAPRPPQGDARWVFAREEGWAAGKGLSVHEIFLKNTYEVLSHVARIRAREPMIFHRKLRPDGRVRETFFGVDLRVLVNFGPGDYEDEDDGVLLPPLGFFVRHPFLRAFHALRVNDVVYDRPAFFAARSLEGKMILRAEEVRIYHGFGPARFEFAGKRFDVEREAVVHFR